MKGHYSDDEKRQMQITAQAKNKSRLQELIDFSKLSGFERLGITSCAGMLAYAKKLVVLKFIWFIAKKAVSMLRKLMPACADPVVIRFLRPII